MRGSSEARIGRHRDHGVDLDENLVALIDDVSHAAHGLTGNLADHLFHRAQLLPGVLRRPAQIAIRMSDGYFCLDPHLLYCPFLGPPRCCV
jgi:hypothetical protein